MEPDLFRLYARAIDTASGKCFCLVGWGPDVDVDGFDITLFHARSLRTYIGKGLQAPPRWIKPDMWLPLAQRALASETQPEGVPFTFNPESGALTWTWPARELGMSAAAQQSIVLRPVHGQAAAGGSGNGGGADSCPLEAMMATVWESCYRLLVSCRQLDAQLTQQTRSLAATRRELQECTEKHKGLVEELHVKFARVLDAKKDKLIQQRTRIQELEEQLRAAQQELAEAEAAQTDEEEGAAEERDPGIHAPGSTGAAGTSAGAGPSTSVPTTRGPAVPYPSIAGRRGGDGSALGLPAAPPAARATAVPAITAAANTTSTAAVGPPVPAGNAPEDLDFVDGMDIDARGWEPPRGQSGVDFVPRASLVASGAVGATGDGGLSGTYASLGSTHVDEDLMMANTLPADRGPWPPSRVAQVPLTAQEPQGAVASVQLQSTSQPILRASGAGLATTPPSAATAAVTIPPIASEPFVSTSTANPRGLGEASIGVSRPQHLGAGLVQFASTEATPLAAAGAPAGAGAGPSAVGAAVLSGGGPGMAWDEPRRDGHAEGQPEWDDEDLDEDLGLDVRRRG